GLPMINMLAPDATISTAGWSAEELALKTPLLDELVGKDRFVARKMIVKWFKEQGLLEDVKPYRHSVGHSYRSHVPIEPYLSDQWYCKVKDERMAGAALRAMAPDQREGSVGATPASRSAADEQRATQASHLRFFPARYA